MKTTTKRNILFVVVAMAVVGFIYFVAGIYLPGGIVVSSEFVHPSGTVEGEVVAIETVSEWRMPDRKEAIVKLRSGETVRAFVPPACVVFVGQIATLSIFNHTEVDKPFYVFKEAKEKNDS